MNIFQTLSRYFGYSSFRPGQQEIIEQILAGENVVAVLPTGAGKSICYQIPALTSNNFSIVVSPLIALMKDQVDNLNRSEEFAAFINSTMSFSEAESVFQRISFGKIKLLYVSPERLEVLIFAERIKKLNPEYLFIDEAHCISEWGHNFRPSYTKLKEFISFTGIKRISAFTATATPEVIKDIIHQLNIKQPKVFVRGFERENLSLNVITTKNKKSETLHLLRSNPEPAIIYTSSRKQAEEITAFLNMSKIPCEFYHAGVNPLIRRKIQDDFIEGRLNVIAATNAFGMGIDKKDIRQIIHYNIPGSIESYYQEIGRAGRDGINSTAILLFDEKDIDIQNYFIEISHPDKEFIQKVYQLICDYGKVAEGDLPDREIAVNTDFLSAVMQKEISKGLLHSALKVLESGGYIRILSEYDNKNSVQILLEVSKLRKLLKGSFNPVLKDLLFILVRESGDTIFSRRVQLDINDISKKTALPLPEIESALEELNDMGFISFRKITGKENITLTKPRVNSSKLFLDYKKINENYLRFQVKLQQMVDFVFTKDCRFKYILSYFGENTSGYNCSKCDRCTSLVRTSGMTTDYVKELVLRTLVSSSNLLNETTLIKVLLGTEKSLLLKGLETFGTASNIERIEIKTAISELTAERLIERNKINIKCLQLTSKGKEFLKINKIIEDPSDYSTDLELFNVLREVRSKAAKKFVQPAYLICPDELLINISKLKPRTKDTLLRVTGFNDRMFIKIGLDFLEVINDFLKEPEKPQAAASVKKSSLPKNIKETYNLLLRKYSLKDMASIQKMSDAVISMQIETILQYHPETDISQLTDPATIKAVWNELEKGTTDLRLLKEVLPPETPFSIIRIVLSKFNALKKESASSLQYKL